MPLRIAIQMDPVETLKPATDSTLVLGIEAQSRGHALYYYTPDSLAYESGEIGAQGWPITLHGGLENHYTLGAPGRLDLRSFDVVLLRQDPPFNMTYLTTTYLLEMLAPQVLVVNDAASVRNLPEKIFPMQFRQYMPPTLVTADRRAIAAFRERHADIVIKPLYGYAGHDVVHLRPGEDLGAALDAAIAPSREPVMVQPFLPEVKDGDRRIILIDGEIGGIMARIPAADDFRANFRVGGHAEAASLTPRQREICEALKPVLKQRGILFAGIDCIGDWLTEINITSPTGLVAMNRLTGQKLETRIWDAIERKCAAR